MTVDKQDAKKKLSLSMGKLGLKKAGDQTSVQQSFSHGRKNTVQVEIKKKRDLNLGSGAKPAPKSKSVELNIKKPAPEAIAIEEPQGRRLTAEEKERRLRVLQQAKQREQELREVAEREARRQEEEREAREAEEARLRDEEEARQRALEELKARELAQETVQETTEKQEALQESAQPLVSEESVEKQQAVKKSERASGDEEEGRVKGKKGKDKRGKKSSNQNQQSRREKPEPPRKAARISVNQALQEDEERQRSLASLRRKRDKEKQQAQVALKQNTKIIREVIIPDTITISELANRMAERSASVIKAMMKMGVIATQNQVIDADTAELVVSDLGHNFKRVSASDVEQDSAVVQDRSDQLEVRPPVVTIMGHVDHGKTSLLDALRGTNVVSGEAGGITQHVGSYQITTKNGERIAFIDTPGHAAFSQMRARGANITDIVVLVVAADDSIKPQTLEALSHARAADVPVIIAINKVDKPGADPQKVKTDLLQHEIQVEDLGGEVQCVEISALQKTGLDALLEQINLQAELLELKANPNRSANGTVIESRLERGRGTVASVLVQGGTLRRGDIVVAGTSWGKVRALLNDQNQQIKAAEPSCPVDILGLNATPRAGDNVIVVENEARARELTEYRIEQQKQASAGVGRSTLEQMFSNIKEGQASDLPIVIRSDVQGSIEAITGALEKLGNDEVKVRILHSAVGPITESDVTLANASNAIVFGFNVRANPRARDAARSVGVDIRYYSIIYELVDDIKALLSGLLKPEEREKFLGYAEIRDVFNITKVGKVAGCYITEGMVQRGAGVRLLRDNVVIHEGKLKTLRRFKEEVREVSQGYECGMAFENYQDIQVDDRIECYLVEQIARTID